jgi:hypothetical protein
MKRTALAIGLLLLSFGCARYYKVIDVETKKVYYTKKVEKLDSGSVTFVNAETGSGATIRAAEVVPIEEEEFDKAVESAK